MKTVYLHGELAEKYGSDPIELHVKTPAMIVRALCSRFGPEFKEYFKETYFKFVVKSNNKEKYITDELGAQQNIDEDSEVHITPAVEGSGRFGQVILGIILIVVGVYFQQPWLWQAGVGLVVGGVAQLLMPTPKIDDYGANERSENKASFVFNGAVNVYEQGGPVPLVYGRTKAGSVVISAGFDIEQIPYHRNQFPDYPDGPRRPNRHNP
jgi:predicted phage tail protein